MQYQTFRGTDVKEALANVRQALGPDALIESTRHVSNGHEGALGHAFVEIVAAPSAPMLKQSARAATGSAQPAGDTPSDRELGASEASRSWLKDTPKQRINKSIQRALKDGKLERSAVERELQQLRAIVEELSQGRSPRDRAHAVLSALGFEGKLARTLALGLSRALREGQSASVWLKERLGKMLLVETNLIDRPYRQLIACVGPTGAGKTTTLAKIAAHALSFDYTVSVISLDTFRVGAQEQWTRYAELLDVPFSVASSEQEFAQLIQSNPTDLVLVDTAGHSVQDDATATRLAVCLQEVVGLRAEVLLVLPAWIRAADAEAIHQAYGEPRPTGLVMTKLDETRQIGGALTPALTSHLPVTYLCGGARVPEDLDDATLEFVLNTLLPEPA